MMKSAALLENELVCCWFCEAGDTVSHCRNCWQCDTCKSQKDPLVHQFFLWLLVLVAIWCFKPTARNRRIETVVVSHWITVY